MEEYLESSETCAIWRKAIDVIVSLMLLIRVNQRNSQKKVDSAFIHPGKLTWNQKITYLKRTIIFQTSIFLFHVNFPGCNCFATLNKHLSLYTLQMVIPQSRQAKSFEAAHPDHREPSGHLIDGIGSSGQTYGFQ